MKIRVHGKSIDTASIERVFTQGEAYADKIVFIVDAANNGVDVSGCTFVMRTVASDDSMTETVLEKSVNGDLVQLTWHVPDTATAVAGMLQLEIIGSQDAQLIIKYAAKAVYVKEAIFGENIPVPDVVEEKLAAMNEILDAANAQLEAAQAKLDEAQALAVTIDDSLTQEGQAADAKAAGTAISALRTAVESVQEDMKNIQSSSDSIQEVIDARTGSIVQNTFGSLAARLNADFGTCITQGELERAISSAIITAVKNAADTGVGRFYYDDDGNVCGEIFNKYDDNKAPGQHAHASGHFAHAGGASAFAHGDTAVANADSAIAIGQSVAAYAANSAAIGKAVQAHSTGQHVYGSWSVDDFEGKYCFIFANGTSEQNRSNGLTFTWDSVLEVKGDVTVPAEDGGEAVSLKAIPAKMAENRSLAESAMGIACKKNLLKYSHTDATKGFTRNGITVSPNADGSINISGTAAATANMDIYLAGDWQSPDIIYPADCYRIHLTHDIGASVTASVLQYDGSAQTTERVSTTSSASKEVEMFITGMYLSMTAKAGTTYNGTIQPMITYAEITDSTYEKYTPSLQEQIDELRSQIAAMTTAAATETEE